MSVYSLSGEFGVRNRLRGDAGYIFFDNWWQRWLDIYHISFIPSPLLSTETNSPVDEFFYIVVGSTA